MRRPAVFMACLAVAACSACGGVTQSTASRAPNCFAGTTGLLSADEIPAGMTLESDGSSPILGLWNNGDANYPGFVGRAQRDFRWSALSRGSAVSGSMPVDHPSQMFHLAESTDDFGNTQGAEKWLAAQRVTYVDNNNPRTRTGITAVLSTPRIGDDTFAYQLSLPPGDLYTGIQSRFGPVILGAAIDTGPRYQTVTELVNLMQSLAAKEQRVCGTA